MHTIDLSPEHYLSIIPALADNYIYLLKGPKGAILIDPGEIIPLPTENLIAILLTHHHRDHIAGAKSYNLPIIGPKEIPIITELAQSQFTLGDFTFTTIHTPGPLYWTKNFPRHAASLF